MDKGRIFLPWILGALLSTATVAAPAPTPPATTSAVTRIQPVTVPTAPNVEPTRRVWECKINGQRTFSDNPCGAKSTLREIGPTNRMDPTPIFPHSRSYVPESNDPPRYSYPSEPADSYPSDQRPADNSYPVDNSYSYPDNSYPVFIGNPFQERRRPNHEYRSHSEDPRNRETHSRESHDGESHGGESRSQPRGPQSRGNWRPS